MGFRGAQKTTPTDFAAPLCIFAALFGYPAELATLIDGSRRLFWLR